MAVPYEGAATSTSTSGGGGSSSTSSKTPPKKTTTKKSSNKAPAKSSQTALVGRLAQAGYTFPFDVSGIIKDAVKNGGTDPFSYFYAKLIKDNRFRNYYQGIFRADGTLKMTPAQWQQYKDTVQANAQKQGFSLTHQQIGQMIAGDNSLDEANFKIQMAARVRANQTFFDSLNQVLSSEGKPTINSAQDAFNFSVGNAAKSVYDTYSAAGFAAAAREAGLDINTDRARELAGGTVGVPDLDQLEQSYAKIAQEIRSAGEDLTSFGLTQRDLETIEFGGEGRASLALKAQQAMAQAQAGVQADVTAEEAQLGAGGKIKAYRERATE